MIYFSKNDEHIYRSSINECCNTRNNCWKRTFNKTTPKQSSSATVKHRQPRIDSQFHSAIYSSNYAIRHEVSSRCNRCIQNKIPRLGGRVPQRERTCATRQLNRKNPLTPHPFNAKESRRRLVKLRGHGERGG